MPTLLDHSAASDLRSRWNAHRAATSGGYLRDDAATLGVSELELLLAAYAAHVTPLNISDLSAVLTTIAEQGTVRTMTRNDAAVIEQDGRYDNLQFFGPAMGQTVGSIDLRIFARRWRFAVACAIPAAEIVRHSVQFFDVHGTSIHKVFLTGEHLATVIARFALLDPPQVHVAPLAASEMRPDEDIDRDALCRDWDALTDTHQFHGLLERHGVSRTQALRLAGHERAVPVGGRALEELLNAIATDGQRVMIFVGNSGVVQIYIGAVRKIVRAKGWLNILEPGFNLHVREGAIATAWIVRKPTASGSVRSLECYAGDGSTIVQLFAKRSDDEPVPERWNVLLDRLRANHA